MFFLSIRTSLSLHTQHFQFLPVGLIDEDCVHYFGLGEAIRESIHCLCIRTYHNEPSPFGLSLYVNTYLAVLKLATKQTL